MNLRNALPVNTAFITNNESEIDPSDYVVDGDRDRSGDLSSQLYTIGSTWGFALFPYAIIAGAIAQSTESPEIRPSFVKIKSKKHYQHILSKYGNVKLNSSISDVISKIGKEDYRDTKNGTNILIYRTKQVIVYGFLNNKLRWIAFDYPVRFRN